jgi:hypothetical protein
VFLSFKPEENMSHCQDVPCIVATLSLVNYPVPSRNEPKLEKVTFGDPEFLYLLATYCFDAQRKLLYATKAGLPLLEQADPELRREAAEDSDAICNAPNWKERALTAESIMLRLQRELSRELRPGESGSPAAVK